MIKILNYLFPVNNQLDHSKFKRKEINEIELASRIIKNRELINSSEWNK